MESYLSLIDEVLKTGKNKKDRTSTGTIAIFGTQKKYNLQKGFPLVTTKKIHWNSIVHELLWFIAGDTNIKYLIDNNVKIWNEWPYQKFQKSLQYNNETMQEFIKLIKSSDSFAKKFGQLGPVYGKQWRNFNGIDQLANVINEIKNNPNSRRLIVSSWNPAEISQMILPPCHTFFQFFINDGEISLHLYQRSADVFLGVPFNIASYSLLLLMVAQVTNLKAKNFVHTTGDTHIYANHLEQVKLQLTRVPKKLPQVYLNPKIKDLFSFQAKDIQLLNYDFYPLIKAKVAI